MTDRVSDLPKMYSSATGHRTVAELKNYIKKSEEFFFIQNGPVVIENEELQQSRLVHVQRMKMIPVSILLKHAIYLSFGKDRPTQICLISRLMLTLLNIITSLLS